jgi:hypothetical protein
VEKVSLVVRLVWVERSVGLARDQVFGQVRPEPLSPWVGHRGYRPPTVASEP